MHDGATWFWIIVLGAVLGWLLGYFVGREGISVGSNILWGILGTCGGALISMLLGLGEPLGLAFLVALAVLFLANVFHEHHLEDIEGGINRGIRLRRKDDSPNLD